MSKCTAAQALKAFEYWLGYYEKATRTYASYRDKKYFETDKGSNNFTYAGYLCGVQGGAWCAMQVSTGIREACGDSAADAKAVMHGVWPYTSCDQLYDAAPAAYKGRRGAWTPKPGDIIVFGRSSREHTGMVYAVDDTYVYTYEGNSSNMCRKRSYPRTSDYIWGYVRPAYAEGASPAISAEPYGAVVYEDIGLHELSKGCAGPEVRTVQRIIYARGIDRTLAVDGEFGPKTKAGVVTLQGQLGLDRDGVVGRDTWAAMLKKLV